MKFILSLLKTFYNVSTCNNCKYHDIEFDECPQCGSTDVYTSGR